MRIRTVLAALTAPVTLGVVTLAPAAQVTPPVGHQVASLLRVKADSATTLNWSGYTVPAPAGRHITAVHTRITVPAAHSQSPGGAVLWAGVGGWTSTDLIQAGVAVGDLLSGGDYAWYELLPGTEIPLLRGCSKPDPTCAVNTGDVIQVDITNVTGDTWRIALNDNHHWTWSKTVTYASTFSSAEWILEAASLLVVPMFVPFVDDTTFGPGNTYALDHKAAQKMASGHPITVNMSLLGAVPEAQPSPVASDGDRFRGCAFKNRCPAP
ncbi:MAG: hypothetical protein ACYDH6_16270 [Acidimicrobiales bacterium]